VTLLSAFPISYFCSSPPLLALQTTPAFYIVPVTVLEVIQRGAEFLAQKGVDSPRLQTELLLAHALKVPRLKLYLNFERVLAPAELDQFRELVRRRSRREPLQHIVGSTSFCGLELAVNRHVLVPRPETELLAETGWRFLNERLANAPVSASAPAQGVTALDFGTGSGCLAIALAVQCPAGQVDAIDISSDAIEVAIQNAVRCDVAGRMRFFVGDGFGALPGLVQYDLLAGNPPYIATAEIAALEPEVRDYDPRTALDGGADGLDFYRRLAVEAGPFLKPGGRLMLELGDGQSASIRAMFEREKWIVESIREDYTQRPRILIARRG
jgi:release factor glutamine methyltransferase